MPNAELQRAIESRCPEIDKAFVQDFFARMDEDYFITFSPEDISTHLRMSHGIDTEHPVRCRITPRGDGEFDIIIVGFDYLSEFSVFCGLLSAFGLDIKSGNIYSFARSASEPAGGRAAHRSSRLRRPSPNRIVDVFTVRPGQDEVFDETRQSHFQEELQMLIRQLAAGSPDRVRDRLNRLLTDRLEKMNGQLSGLLSPIEVRFDNLASPDWTLMNVRSQDAFAFLYAFSNALAMRGIYIHKVRIESVQSEVRDQFFIADRRRYKIESEQEQERLRTAVVLIKRFTRFLPEAPDPARAMRHFDQFLDKVAEEHISDQFASFFAGEEGMNLLAHLLGSSDFLWDEFLRFKELLPILPILKDFSQIELRPGKRSLRDQLDAQLAGAATFEEKKRAINQFKDRQVFLIDIKHLLDPQTTLVDFSHALTDLAEVILDKAAAVCLSHLVTEYGEPMLMDGSSCRFTICGLGKFGGCEMGYASDLEVLFVYDGPGKTRGDKVLDNGIFFELLVQKIAEFIEAREKGVFHIDLRLRPHGKAGPLASPYDQLAAYYSSDGEAAPFERQALIKLRWVAGDEALGHRVEAHRGDFTYSGVKWDQENALHLRRRQERELVRIGEVNVKYSPGGIIDIEYAAQYLQIIYGKDHPGLRTTNTMEALDELHRLRIIARGEHDELRAAYTFLRRLIDALRLVRGDASDLVLPEESSEEYKSLARRMGYQDKDRRKSAERLAANIGQLMKQVRSHYLSRFNTKNTKEDT
jgi:[glutamine synthetase] adenylyltransferase / [glutamine synthetase]-adenylyl-L-tyrosine phosphorylase